jgi:hypothetical protein
MTQNQLMVLPKSIDNATHAELEQRLGIKLAADPVVRRDSGKGDGTTYEDMYFQQYELPGTGWTQVPSGVSDYQLRLVNPAGEQVAKVLYGAHFHCGNLELLEEAA